jgi:hypothetical protein
MGRLERSSGMRAAQAIRGSIARVLGNLAISTAPYLANEALFCSPTSTRRASPVLRAPVMYPIALTANSDLRQMLRNFAKNQA